MSRAAAKKGETILGLAPEDLDMAAMGSLNIDDEELDAAFEFFDVDKTGKITAANLKERLGASLAIAAYAGLHSFSTSRRRKPPEPTLSWLAMVGAPCSSSSAPASARWSTRCWR